MTEKDELFDALVTAGKTNPAADNAFMVGISGGGNVVLCRPPLPMMPITKARALELAAWIVTLCHDDAAWAEALNRVQR